MSGLTVKEFIKALEQFPEDAEITVSNECGEYEGAFILGIDSDSESDGFGGLLYNEVAICVIPSYHQDYVDLVDDEWELFGEQSWYNTEDFIDTYDDQDNRVRLYFDEETKKFKQLECNWKKE